MDDSLVVDSLAVGKCYPRYSCHEDIEIRMHYSGYLWEAAFMFRGITKHEVDQFLQGNIIVATAYVDDCMFFLFKVGAMAWADAPYEPRLNKTAPEFLSFDVGKGAPLLVLSSEGSTGEVKSLHPMGLGNVMSNRMSDFCRKACENKSSFRQSTYYKKLDNIYKKYPTTEAMLKVVDPKDVIIFSHFASQDDDDAKRAIFLI